ncbi:hypothetical protein A9Z06_27515 [Rhizobium sp. YK2]|nr:hypothetical protein A9Z06_27515 [Rhizobium sp. YK2]
MIIRAANSTGLRSAEKQESEARPMEISALDLVINVEASAAWDVEVLGMKRLEYGTDRDRPRTALLFGSGAVSGFVTSRTATVSRTVFIWRPLFFGQRVAAP